MKSVHADTQQLPMGSLLKFGAVSMAIAASMILALVVGMVG